MNDLRDQEEREAASVTAGVHRYERQRERGLANVASGRQFIAVAQRSMVTRLNADRAKPGQRYRAVIPMLTDMHGRPIDPYVLAELTSLRLLEAAYRHAALTPTAEALGRDVRDHVKDAALADPKLGMPKLFEKKLRRLKRTQSGYFRRKSIDGDVKGKLAWSEREGLTDIAAKFTLARGPEWSAVDLATIGGYLIGAFADSTKLVRTETVRRPSKKNQTRLRLTTRAQEWLDSLDDKFRVLRPVHVPMTTVPRDWHMTETLGFAGEIHGGYLDDRQASVKFVKTRARTFEEAYDLSPVFEAVNIAQRTAWRVNKPVLDVMKTVWNAGTGLGNVPPKYTDDAMIPLPVKPKEFERLTTEQKNESAAWKAWIRRRAFIHQSNTDKAAEVRAFGPRMSLSAELSDYAAFYHPHTLDFRGRAYPVSALLSPQGGQFDRGLLEFAEGRRMGDSEDSGRWLAIHGANLYGVDKVPFDDRVAWVEEYEEEILASAADPFENKFWTLADGGAKAWPFLAFAVEWRGYKRDGDEFMTHLPIALDGSNSGLQHLSAMLRDDVGGRLTNVMPSEGVEDIYRTVAESLSREVTRLATKANEPDPRKRKIARLWRDSGGIDRKLCKPGVMTTPYGVTLRALTEQIEFGLFTRDAVKGLDQSYLNLPKGVTNEDAASWLAVKLRAVIADHVPSAVAAMSYMQKIARTFSQTGLPLRWSTPLGFPALQYYTKGSTKRIRVYVGGRPHHISVREDNPRQLDSKGAARGVSPNFVHSQDAAHLMMTVLRAYGEGVTSFALVHDSFGTHATNTRLLAEALREAFVDLYSEDRLAQFRTEVEAALVSAERPDLIEKLPEPPESGTLDLETVRNSDYFFA